MSAEKILRRELESCFSDWEGDFDVDIEQDDIEDDTEYFSVIVSHMRLGDDYHFTAKVYADGECWMDYCDDSWHEISPAAVFTFMWFEEATVRSNQ